jgi:hypothetical protein
VIVRILAEGQWTVADDQLDRLNALDSALEAAIADGDALTFAKSLEALLDAVRTSGSPLPDDALDDSDLILPPADATLEEVRELLNDDGLIPG